MKALIKKLFGNEEYKGVVQKEPISQKSAPVAEGWPIDEVIMSLGSSFINNAFIECEPITPRDLFQSICVFGQQGSGKSTGSMAHIAKGLLSQRWGGLVLSAKKDEADEWKKYWNKVGRTDNLVIFGEDDSPDSPCVNFLDYELNHGAGKGSTSNLVLLLTELAALTRKGDVKSSASDFFDKQCAIALTNAIEFLRIVTGTVSVVALHQLFSNLPTSISMQKSKEWQDSWLGQLMISSRSMKIPPERKSDYDLAIDYMLNKWPQLAEETRSSVDMTILNVLDPFLRYPLRRLFCEKTTWDPADTFRKGMVTVVGESLAVKAGGPTERFAQVLLKILVQRSVEREAKLRKSDSSIPIFIFMDEGQVFVTKSDKDFLQTARSVRCATIFGTQNLGNIYSEIGKENADSLLGLFAFKIFHQNGDHKTNEWAATTIGKKLTRVENASSNLNAGRENTNITQGTSSSMQELYRVEPWEFQGLSSGGPENGNLVCSIVFRAGRPFVSSGDNWGVFCFFQR